MRRQSEAKGIQNLYRYVAGHISALLLLPLLVFSPPGLAQTGSYVLEFGGARETSELRLSIGKSQIINSRNALDQVVIGNPEIADIKLLSSTQVLILGKKPGHTNLVFRNKQRDLSAIIDVVVGYDLDGIKRKIYEVLPNEPMVEIRGANDAVMLSGEISSLQAMDKALSVAASYVPKDKVINLLQVGGGQQVMLEAKISEMARRAVRELGVEMSGSSADAAGRTISIITGGGFAPTPAFFDGTYSNPVSGIADALELRIKALETKGLAKTLAEPNIVALSGQEASFLAGGELPVPVAQTSGLAGAVITVEYKEFGVGLKFTPTVLSSGKINLKLNSEVSAIDTTTSTPVGGGISVPGFTTRRAGTTIEAADGQSFAIAGLLQSDMNNAIEQVPGLGDIPILGVLFRSTEYQRNETELVVVVTPKLVKPVHGSKLRAPTDNFVPPNAFDQYLMGRLEGPPPKKKKTVSSEVNESTGGEPPAEGESSVQGSFGHAM
jgi:pilus assembly protein CpaC